MATFPLYRWASQTDVSICCIRTRPHISTHTRLSALFVVIVNTLATVGHVSRFLSVDSLCYILSQLYMHNYRPLPTPVYRYERIFPSPPPPAEGIQGTLVAQGRPWRGATLHSWPVACIANWASVKCV